MEQIPGDKEAEAALVPRPQPLCRWLTHTPSQAFKTSTPSSLVRQRLGISTMQLNFGGLRALVTGAGKGGC